MTLTLTLTLTNLAHLNYYKSTSCSNWSIPLARCRLCDCEWNKNKREKTNDQRKAIFFFFTISIPIYVASHQVKMKPPIELFIYVEIFSSLAGSGCGVKRNEVK